jgi:putative DNA primase/helicase
LIPDNDDAGWDHVNQIGAQLHGVAARVRVLVLPNLPPKGDVSDWIAGGGTREQLDVLLDQAQDWKPPSADKTSEPNEDQKAKAKAREDELLDALAKDQGGPLQQERLRKAAAKELGASLKAIEEEIEVRREDAQVAPLYGHWIVEPWPEPVEGDSLLRDIIKRIHRHVVISYDGALVIALWIMMSWVHDDIATHSPILNINSAEPESGKSTTMGLVAFLMPKCIASVEASEAAIYRAIKRWAPSFCFDEFDSILAGDDKAGLRSVINSGHTKGAGVMRCIGDDNTPEMFPTFAPKVIGMVGRKLPPATLSRCIFVELRRRKKDEFVEKFRHRDDSELADLRRRLRRWAMDNEDILRSANPTMPDELTNRRADNWQLQLAIADLCSGVEDFGDKARAAAIKIEGKADSRTVNVHALAAIKVVFESTEDDTISSEDLIQKMTAEPDSEWAEWKAGKQISQAQLARLLKRYGIIPERVQVGKKRVRGYLRAHFVDAWETWL